MGGRALLRKKGGQSWALILCAGDGIKTHEALVKAGISSDDAATLERELAIAEGKLPPEQVAMLFSDPALGQSTHVHHASASQLLDAASSCVKLGLVCIDHCQQTLASGDTSLAACERSVDQMVSICGTLAKLASVKSSYLAGLARVALVACQDCETECSKHADKHSASKAWRLAPRLAPFVRRSARERPHRQPGSDRSLEPFPLSCRHQRACPAHPRLCATKVGGREFFSDRQRLQNYT